MEGTGVSGQGFCFRDARFWPLAVLTTAATLGFAPLAEAAFYYSPDYAPVANEPPARTKVRPTKVSRRGDKKSDAAVEREAKPQGPLIISISIAQQKLRLYDANGLFAEAPVSTGMKGHTTPMGAFSVIQKQKLHHSNIYSGAPMPFMQRITWSGIAMHAGVLPGYPASHGCIRMPMAFAVKMYGWTKMGARVIVAPGNVTPASFSHPLLSAIKVVPQPVAVEETKADVVAVKLSEKPAQTEATAAPVVPDAKIELRPSVGHVDEVKSTEEESRPAVALQTADASGALPTVASTSGTPEAVPAGDPASPRTAKTDAAGPDAPKHDETVASNEKPSAEKPAETASAQASKPDAATPPETASESATVPAEAPKPNQAESDTAAQKPADAAKAATPSPEPVAQAVVPAKTEALLRDDLKSEFAKTAAAKPQPGFSFKKTGQIAVFVSRKDAKLYIRQDFAPLYEVPVTIAADTRPLGTHIFTAQVDSADSNVLHWSVVSLPMPAKSAERRAEDERGSRGRKFASAGPIEAKPLPVADSPAEALDRLSLPAEVMAKIYEAVSTGGSIIVSDQGIAAGETGEGTDFIVSLR